MQEKQGTTTASSASSISVNTTSHQRTNVEFAKDVSRQFDCPMRVGGHAEPHYSSRLSLCRSMMSTLYYDTSDSLSLNLSLVNKWCELSKLMPCPWLLKSIIGIYVANVIMIITRTRNLQTRSVRDLEYKMSTSYWNSVPSFRFLQWMSLLELWSM